MNLKEFLKPNLWKITIYVIVFFFIYFSFLSSICMQLSVNCDEIFYVFPFAFLSYFGIIIGFTLLPFFIIVDSIKLPFPELVLLIIFVIESYIVSCIIVWIKNKVKKK